MKKAFYFAGTVEYGGKLYSEVFEMRGTGCQYYEYGRYMSLEPCESKEEAQEKVKSINSLWQKQNCLLDEQIYESEFRIKLHEGVIQHLDRFWMRQDKVK